MSLGNELNVSAVIEDSTLNVSVSFVAPSSTATVDDTVTESSANAVKSSGIWAWVKGLFTSHKEEENAHDASTIKYNEMTVQGALELMPQPQIQSDWNQTDNILKDYIKNKPTPLTGLTFTGEVNLSRLLGAFYLDYTMVGALALTVASGAVIGGYASGIIIGDGTNTPSLTGIVLDSNSSEFNPSNGIKNKFTIAKFQNAVYISYTEVL